ncbi:MAG: nucleoside-triphosphatase [Candidatus Aminicenantales bacterium]
MPRSRRLDDTWLKAAALGCIWASAEIVLGSFLHNLGIPMAGTIMAGIGIVLMVAVGSLWPVRGLFWRAGLVCALMRALTPGTIIFGPMIAITCQAGLMELSVRFFRRNAFSWLLGSMLAMSWNIAQFVLRNLLVYGSGAVDLYMALLRWSEKNLGLPAGDPWLPIVLVLVLNLAAGLAAGLLGLFIGRRAAREPLEMSSLSSAQVMKIRAGQSAREFPYSIGWLLADLVMLAGVLALAQSAAWTIWLTAGLLAMGVWILRYREAARPLLRTKFWIWFFLLTGLSGALLSSLKHGWSGLLGGVGIGLAMNFRAAVLVVGFSALGTELRSPRVGKKLSRGRFRPLAAALETAIETLPQVIANLPKLEDVFRRPVTVFHRVVVQADFWFKRLTLDQARRRGVLLLSGQVREGKSHALQALIQGLRADGHRVAGILSPSVVQDGRHIGFDLVDIATGRRTELSRIAGESEAPGLPSVGRFVFKPEGLRAGQAALSVQATAGADVIVVDEVGPWELKDQGWAGPLYELTLETKIPMIWVVRSDIMDQVRAHWALQDPRIVDVSGQSRETLLEDMREWLAGAKTGNG